MQDDQNNSQSNIQDDTQISQNHLVDELEATYKQTMAASSTSTTTNPSSLSDEKQKISTLLVEIDSLLANKKTIVEKKLSDLKVLKSEIEAGLEELKKVESKKMTLQEEAVKIQKIEADQKQIETEVANISTTL